MVGNSFKLYMGSDPNVFLFAYENKPIYRHSYTARYKIYDSKTRM